MITLEKWLLVCELLEADEFDEGAWQAWLSEGRWQELSSYAGRVTAVKWISLTALALGAAVAWWSAITPFGVALGLLAAAGSRILMFQAAQAPQFTFAIAFGEVPAGRRSPWDNANLRAE